MPTEQTEDTEAVQGKSAEERSTKLGESTKPNQVTTKHTNDTKDIPQK